MSEAGVKVAPGAHVGRLFLNPYRVISDTYGVFVYDPDAGFAELENRVAQARYGTFNYGIIHSFDPKVVLPILQHVHDAQGLQIVLEAAPVFHTIVQRLLTRMAERGMAEIMRQAKLVDCRAAEAVAAHDTEHETHSAEDDHDHAADG